MVEGTSFYRDTWVEINLDYVRENITSMFCHLEQEKELFAVVKANAYGHGDAQVAKAALEAGASYLAVAFLDEGLTLRQKGITAPILVLGASRFEDINVAAENNITLTVFQLEWMLKAKQLYNSDKQVSFHLKFDTGMGRLGARDKQEVLGIYNVIEEVENFILEGVYTHFATADELENSYFNHQYQRFLTMLSWIPQKPKYTHCANSATGLRFPEKIFNAVRLGISMYGLSPSPEIMDKLPYKLKSVFSLHSRLVHVKKINKGESVSYGATYTAQADEWVGTVPIGYADGWIRKNQGSEVLVAGERCQIIGRVCMDQIIVRIPRQLPVGTQVTLIGSQGEEEITADEVAKRLETINYEITCMINYRVPRIFFLNKSIIEVRNYILGNK
jgi:alanine racemase